MPAGSHLFWPLGSVPSGGSSQGSGGGWIFPAAGGGMVGAGIAESELVQRTAGTYTILSFRVNGATCTCSSTKNGGAGNLTVTSTSAGEFKDTTHSDTVSVADTYGFTATNTSGAARVGYFGGCQFQASGTTVVKAGTSAPNNYSVASTTSNVGPFGSSGPGLNSWPSVLTVSKLRIRATTNARSTVTTGKIFIAGVGGNNVVTWAASTGGAAEDTTHIDTTSSMQSIIASLITGTGAGNFNFSFVTVDISSTDGVSVVANGHVTNPASGASLTQQTGIDGTIINTNVTPGMTSSPGTTARNASMYSYINTRSNTGTWTLSGTSIAISIAGGVVGLLQDTTHTASLNTNQEYHWAYSIGSAAGTWQTGTPCFEMVGSPDTNIKTINGLAYSTLTKTVNGLPKASIKSIDGLQ